jgi:2,4-dienoyl-CoA reductase-like NADH-dependent reductase (Old Yellow Enzyme family)
MPEASSLRVFDPLRVGPLELRNRFVRAAAFESMAEGGLPSRALTRYHERLGAGGVALTTVAYAAVCASGRSYPRQVCAWLPGVGQALCRLTDAVHRRGAAVSLQLAHAGHAADPAWCGGRPLAPSRVLDRYHLSLPRAMDETDLEEVADAFGAAARVAADSGCDAVEVHAAHGYLLSQFLSPWTNRRRDRWGGDLEGRLRFPLEVVRRVRDAAGPGLAVIVKMNLSDGFRGGLEPSDAVEVARRLEAEGVDALVLSGGFMTRTPIHVMRGEVPHRELRRGVSSRLQRVGAALLGRWLIPRAPFREAYFLEDARQVRRAVRLPLALLGGLRRLETLESAVAEGFDLVALARPLVAEPDLVERFRRGQAASRCEPCNRCLAAVAVGALHCPLLESPADAEHPAT